MTRTIREKQLFIVTIICCLAYLSFNLILKPLKAKIASQQKDIAALQKQLKKNLKVIKKAEMLNETYNIYINTFKQTKSNEQVMSSILSEIGTVAGEKNLQIAELKPKTVSKNDTYNQFPVSLAMNCELNDLIRFLHSLQKQKS